MTNNKKPRKKSDDVNELDDGRDEDRNLDREDEQEGVEDEDFSDELESEFQNDVEEAAEAELAALLEETGGHLTQRAGNLVIKLEQYPDGAFPISPYSTFKQDRWTLFKNKFGATFAVIFDGMTQPMKELKKGLVYYGTPDFSPFGNIRSYKTTIWQAGKFSVLQRYLFEPNFLDGTPETIGLINHRMINKALDNAKNSTTGSHYHYLFSMIRLWTNLSIQGLMPPGLSLDIDMRKVDSIERRRDVVQHFTGNMSTWRPFSEEDLAELIDYALFWTEKALPRLLNMADYIKEKKLDQLPDCAVIRYSIDAELEQNINIKVDDITVVSPSRMRQKYEYAGRHEQFFYRWLHPYSVAIDKVRNGIFVLLALITGLRASELSLLKFDDVVKNGNGDYTIRVARFKTADDPNVNGETDFLPLPRFIGEKIDELEKLRSVYTLFAKGYIFQSSKSRKEMNKPNSSIVKGICRELGEATNVDRIHAHRFRKTIAEILINRNERNIDLVRHLFGHKSFAMTLKYIGRNPHIVRSVALAIEQNYTAEFTELVSAVKSGASSGPNAQRLVDRIKARPDAFSGKQLKVTIFVYISHLLSSGEPLFIHRTALGSYCVSTETYSSPHLPPCLTHMTGTVTNMLPNPARCDISCKHIVVVEKAKQSMQDNVKFYSNMLEKAADTLSEQAKKMIRNKIASNLEHLHNLETTSLEVENTGCTDNRIPVEQVTI
ncbi:tyrosine-type recombinase/integrase [Pseudomonas sp. PD9R]|uniref:tyrosine-type recombinase/integrase n=1 Tax=Pseudomonas sp. PD9R TaxID=2853534 RepID=UPI001C488A63|nr:tyrosine-type recombinase/integrase [Pseudomonas sp. PD9R]MBV6825704.1 tyrosine-type recombinase/integrase [Pseudomonas sp. PD9R]